MRFAIAAAGLFLALPAHAGGIGVIATGGAHTERLWYHADHVGDVELTDPREFPEYEMSQTLLHGGGGLELVLGDRDDRFLGTFRWYALADAPQVDPAEVSTEGIKTEYIVAAYRDTTKTTGVGAVGLTWGFLDIGESMRFGASAHVGSGFLTPDHSEFLIVDLGPTLSIRPTRALMAYVDVPWQMRWRKGTSHSVNAFVGMRYMFD